MLLRGAKHITGMEFIPPNTCSATNIAPDMPGGEVHKNLAALESSGIDIKTLEAFDWSNTSKRGAQNRKKYKPETNDLLLDGVLMQGSCGNCWAMSSTSALTDRFIIAKKLSGLHLDPLILTTCEHYDHGCQGGHPAYAGVYFENKGTAKPGDGCASWSGLWDKYVKEKGYPPPEMTNSYLPSCSDMTCKRNYMAAPASTRRLSQAIGGIEASINAIKTELVHKGPVVGTYAVWADFIGGTGNKGSKAWNYMWKPTNGIYINGVYDDELNGLWEGGSGLQQQLKAQGKWKGWGETQVGGHAVVIVGWDHDVIEIGGNKVDVEYWIVKNSWSDKWNQDGYFKYAITQSPHNFNNRCGLGVGINQGGQVAFGAVKFDADVNSGAHTGTVFKKPDKTIHKAIIPILGVIILVLLLVGAWMYWGNGKGKKSRKRK